MYYLICYIYPTVHLCRTGCTAPTCPLSSFLHEERESFSPSRSDDGEAFIAFEDACAGQYVIDYSFLAVDYRPTLGSCPYAQVLSPVAAGRSRVECGSQSPVKATNQL